MNKTNGVNTQAELDNALEQQPDLCEGFERGELPKNRRIRHIKWSPEFKSWPIHRKLKRAMDMASSINDALDIMQTERNKLLIVCSNQEANIKRLLQGNERSGQVLHTHMTRSNEVAQQRAAEIQELKAQLRVQAKVIQELGGGDNR